MLPSPSPVPLGPRAFLTVTGPDALRFLNGQLTNDVTLVSPERSLPAAALNAKGGLDAICCVHRITDGYLLDTPLALRDELLARLDRYLIADEVTLKDESDSWSLVHVLDDPPTGDKGPLLVTSCARFGRPGYDLVGFAATAPTDVPSLDEDEWEHQRIEEGIPAWGKELTPGLLPAEAGLDTYMVSFDKGCYLGQEVVSRVKRAGKTNRHLVTLTVPAGTTAPAAIYHDGKVAGEITSVSPKAGLALGFRKRSAEKANEFSLQADGSGELVRVR